jgi:hypothetical protein
MIRIATAYLERLARGAESQPGARIGGARRAKRWENER